MTEGSPAPGSLVVVGTPIGNLGDLSPRVIEALGSADAIACEDTRRTGRLLAHAGVRSPALLVANEHTEVARTAGILDRLARGQRVALVSDAGMPTVSDPGRRIVDAVARAGYHVTVVPGPVAATTALAVSGFEADRFVFEGFLPRKGPVRAERLAALAAEERTMVLYEAPHRLRRTLADLTGVFGPDRPVAVVRELTKLHEEVLRGSLGEAETHFADVEPRGELVIVVAGQRPAPAEVGDGQLAAALDAALARGLSRRDAVSEVVADTGAAKRRVYDLATGVGPSGPVGFGAHDPPPQDRER
jgi:16S rRNA (cytidine1402-2'-O)-methyltransferase